MNRLKRTLLACGLLLAYGCVPTQAPVVPLTEVELPPEPVAIAAIPEPEPFDSVEPLPAEADPSREAVREDPPTPPEPSKVDLALAACQAAQVAWENGDTDTAMANLDEAYALILEARDDTPEALQQKDNLRISIAKRIMEIYSARTISIEGKHASIPVPLNEHVQKEIKRFTGNERRFFRESYRRSGQYRPMIAAKLKEAGLPKELIWLPLIESGYKVRALSKARALGLWQFIPSTGYKFGLKRDLYVDERLDPEKATDAAIAYLKELHNIFGDWSTALAAYNCGEGRVLRTIRKQNVNYLDNFWDLYGRLPNETARYVPRFLATLEIVRNMEKYGFDPKAMDEPELFDVVKIDHQSQLRDLAPPMGVTEKELRRLNPELRYRIVPSGTYALKVPKGKGDLLLAAIQSVPVSRGPQNVYVYHRIGNGEALSSIARKYKTSVKKIMAANNLRSANRIRAGKVLRIPAYGGPVLAPRRVSDVPAAGLVYKVQKGDSLWSISQRFGISTRTLKQANNLSLNTLRIGQKLQIPGNGQQVTNPGSASVYLVKVGDSPFKIALKHNMPLRRFLKLNNLSANSTIYPGQKVLVE